MTVLPKPTDATTSIPSSGILERMHEWVTSVDHKKLGMMYIFSGIFFFMLEFFLFAWFLLISFFALIPAFTPSGALCQGNATPEWTNGPSTHTSRPL